MSSKQSALMTDHTLTAYRLCLRSQTVLARLLKEYPAYPDDLSPAWAAVHALLADLRAFAAPLAADQAHADTSERGQLGSRIIDLADRLESARSFGVEVAQPRLCDTDLTSAREHHTARRWDLCRQALDRAERQIVGAEAAAVSIIARLS